MIPLKSGAHILLVMTKSRRCIPPAHPGLGATGKITAVQLPLEDMETDARQYDEERGEVGGFGAAAGKVPCWAAMVVAKAEAAAAAARTAAAWVLCWAAMAAVR